MGVRVALTVPTRRCSSFCPTRPFTVRGPVDRTGRSILSNPDKRNRTDSCTMVEERGLRGLDSGVGTGREPTTVARQRERRRPPGPDPRPYALFKQPGPRRVASPDAPRRARPRPAPRLRRRAAH